MLRVHRHVCLCNDQESAFANVKYSTIASKLWPMKFTSISIFVSIFVYSCQCFNIGRYPGGFNDQLVNAGLVLPSLPADEILADICARISGNEPILRESKPNRNFIR
jgi:hypothetical protein